MGPCREKPLTFNKIIAKYLKSIDYNMPMKSPYYTPSREPDGKC
jgi:hypothetical protein